MSQSKNNQPESENIDLKEAEDQYSAEGVEELDNDTGQSDSQAPEGEAPELDPVEQLSEAQLEIAKLKDAFLRAKAEEDNLRRRSEREMANSRKFAVESFAKEILNVHDSLKLACTVELAEDAEDAVKSIHEGVQITLKQLDAALAKFAVVEIAPEVGDKLDPNLHQAMSLIESEEIGAGCIINVIQPGFKLHDRLLRPSLVVVAK